MKQISILSAGFIIISISLCMKISAQNQVRLSRGIDKDKLLTANFSGNSVERVEWKLDGTTVATSGSSRKGVTVAGGHCIGDANQLNGPNGVFVDREDNVWVADASNGRIQKYARGSTNGITIGAEFPNAPSFPTNIFINRRGDIYVADYFEAKVKLLVKNGKEWVNVAGQNNELDLVRGVWVDDEGNVYCTQYGFFFNGTFNLDGMILKYPRNSSAFEIVAGHNGIGSALNQFSAPTSVVLDKYGNIYVADGANDHGNQNSRVMKWAPGAKQGVIVAGGNGEGEASNQCPYPVHASLDQNGSLYVSNYTSGKVTKWKPGAKKGEIVAGGNGIGSAADQLSLPIGNYVKDKYLYVVDLGNNRVQRFDLSGSNFPKCFKPRHHGNYSVVATFTDGTMVESNSIAVPDTQKHDKPAATNKLKTEVYPNPAKGIISIRYQAENTSQFTLQLTDMSGRILLSKIVNTLRGTNNETIDLSPYSKGGYFINILKPGQAKESMKIIKE